MAGRQLTELTTATAVWLQQHFLEILIGLAAGTLIVMALYAIRGLGARLCRRDRTGTGWATIFGRAIDKTGNLFIIATAAKLVDGYAQPPLVLQQTIDFVFVIASVIQVAVWVREIILGFVEHRTSAGDHDTLGSAMGIIRLLVTVALFAIAAIVILDNLGVNVTGLVAGLGIGGIAIGLAAQGIFADLFAALSILFDRPFRRGDSIAYDQTNATVEAIGLKSTRLRSVTGEQRVISNKNLLDKEIRNNSRVAHRRGEFTLGVVSQLDPARADKLPALLREIVESAGQQFVRAGFVGFGASTLDFEVEWDVESPDMQAYHDARHRVGMAILKRFAEEKIDFAYPSQTPFTAAPDGRLIMPYPDVQPVKDVSPAPPHDPKG
ncbi:mechanosensitive ion channel family protein [Sphingomonas tabacisoli]|uniref:Mechanosensitive ion channel family protein n=1 Tax=Sphingomonas tabacisoli TaxID=2249466 RepID=A0ABW4I0I7_9SPHN